MQTRRANKVNVTSPQNRVDKGLSTDVAFGPSKVCVPQQNDLSGDKAMRGGRTKIHEDTWYEFILIANYIYRNNPEAEVADVFEWIRLHDLGGQPISRGLLARITREINTEMGMWNDAA